MNLMKRVSAVAVMGVIVSLVSTQSQAQLPVIESLSLNGELICTGLRPGSTATVEWAPTVNGPWTNSWAGMDAVVVGNDGTILVKVPMFYRVRGEAEPVGLKGMVWIAPGTFTMGSPASEPDRSSDEGPLTVVTISRGFFLGNREVTQREYMGVMGGNPSYFTGDLDRPVEQVSWNDALSYCEKLTQQERTAGRLPEGYEYRLPTEAQWEYACRAGTTTATAYGNSLSSAQANFIGEYPYNGGAAGPRLGQTAKVGSYTPNAWGLYDMHGNVWEWCADWYSGSYSGGSVTDPGGPSSGSRRVVRGGGWLNFFGRDCRSANRGGNDPSFWSFEGGFRTALVAVP
jgi:formylglycine-generating enzyme required for sulfatase activity